MHALPGDRESMHTVLQSHSCPIFIQSKTNSLLNARSGATAYFMYFSWSRENNTCWLPGCSRVGNNLAN